MLVKQRTDQTMSTEEAHLVPFLAQNDEFTLENTASNSTRGVVLNAALYTAVGGEFERNGAETPLLTIHRNPLKQRHLTAKNGKGRYPAETAQITTAEDKGFEPSTGLPATDFESDRSPFAYPPKKQGPPDSA